MAEPLGLAASAIGLISLAEKIIDDSARFVKLEKIIFMLQDKLPIILGFLADIKNTFLNAREGPPRTAKLAIDVCFIRLEGVERDLERSRPNSGYKSLLRQRPKAKRLYLEFRESVMLLKDICTL